VPLARTFVAPQVQPDLEASRRQGNSQGTPRRGDGTAAAAAAGPGAAAGGAGGGDGGGCAAAVDVGMRQRVLREAALVLAFLHLDGEGVARDRARACLLFKAAAGAGCAEAAKNLGTIFRTGQYGDSCAWGE
jgi:TPR repeat protein